MVRDAHLERRRELWIRLAERLKDFDGAGLVHAVVLCERMSPRYFGLRGLDRTHHVDAEVCHVGLKDVTDLVYVQSALLLSVL